MPSVRQSVVLGLLVAAGCGPDTQATTAGQSDTEGGTAATDDGVEDGGDTTVGDGVDGTADEGASSDGAQEAVTYHRDVRPVIERHCGACHIEGNIAPLTLGNYDEAFALRESIASSVAAGTMPPWGMDGECGEYVGDSSLSDTDRAMLQAWVDQGAPEGNPEDFAALDPIVLPELSRTDLTLGIAEPYLPTQMPDEYRCFVIPWPEAETTYVTGFEFEADNESITHHAIAYIVSPDEVEAYEQRDDDDPGPGYTCFGGPGGSMPLDFITSRWLSAWAPGARVGDLPEGTGLRIDPGSSIVLQMHYNTLASNGEPDQSRMNYRLDSAVEREALMLPWADPSWIGGAMPIPAGSEDTVHSFALDPTTVINLLTDDAIPEGVPLEFFSAIHHMHRRGSRGFQTIERADGTSECLLNVPRYDYDWQHSYRYAQSKILQPGDQLRLECQWDNGANDSAINWGDGTDDEMCLGIHYVAAAQ